jgi:hypothetical protein
LLDIRALSWNMAVNLDWQGRVFDRVFDLDMYKVRKVGEFYACSDCMDYRATKVIGPVQFFPSVAALRIKHHPYEEFLDWCNEVLFPARYIQMEGVDGATWASLLRDTNAPRAQAIPNLTTGLVKFNGTSAVQPEDVCCFYLPVWLPPFLTMDDRQREQ